MSHYGDVEAHRRIIEEIGGSAAGVPVLAYVRAAVVGSMGSAKAYATLQSTPGLVERPSRIMRVQLALLSFTLRASTGNRRYAQERQAAAGVILEEAAYCAQQQQQQQRQGKQLLERVSGAATVNAMASWVTPLRSAWKDPEGPTAAVPATGGMNEEFLNSAMAYVNYFEGFTTLWSELFGAHYWVVNNENGSVEGSQQVPPHLYAVNWRALLTPERLVWSKGLHAASKHLLKTILTRAVPVDAYFLYVLFSALSLRMRLLETAAELFTWSSFYLDSLLCVRQLHLSYQTQCEYARLQDVWHSLNLFDESFLDDCSRFNLACSAAQGAFLETVSASSQGPVAPFARVPRGQPAETLDGFVGSGAAPLSSDLAGAAASALPAESLSNSYTGTPYRTLSSASSSEGSDVDADGLHVVAHETASHLRRRLRRGQRKLSTEKEVYVPIFYTRCLFVWLLQRMFWSMYGRCTLLFSSCIRLDLAPSLNEHFLRYCESVSQVSPAFLVHVGQQTSQRRVPVPGNEAETHPLSLTGEDAVSTAPTANGCAAPTAVLSSEPQAPFYFRFSWHTESVEGGHAAAGVGTERLRRAVPSPSTSYLTDFTFLSMGGCYVLAHSIQAAMMSANYPATLMMLTDNTTRPGPRNWLNHRYTVSSVPDDRTARQGLEPWVLNFVLPRNRMSSQPQERAAQEGSLLRTLVFQLSGRRAERIVFTHQRSLFFVLNGGPYLDGGRNYFVLHLHVDRADIDSPGGTHQGTAPGAQLLQTETPRSFAALEEIRLAWYMSCSCTEALRLAAAIDGSDEE